MFVAAIPAIDIDALDGDAGQALDLGDLWRDNLGEKRVNQNEN